MGYCLGMTQDEAYLDSVCVWEHHLGWDTKTAISSTEQTHARLFIHSFIHSFVCLFVCLFVRWWTVHLLKRPCCQRESVFSGKNTASKTEALELSSSSHTKITIDCQVVLLGQ